MRPQVSVTLEQTHWWPLQGQPSRGRYRITQVVNSAAYCIGETVETDAVEAMIAQRIKVTIKGKGAK